jgi:lipoprotein-releasing system permease protein
MVAQNSPRLLDFNRQAIGSSGAKTRKGAIENPEEAFNKTDLIPVGIYAISEDLDSKYVLLI